jgi:hypothetical protein
MKTLTLLYFQMIQMNEAVVYWISKKCLSVIKNLMELLDHVSQFSV